jgi:hypothetical protein
MKLWRSFQNNFKILFIIQVKDLNDKVINNIIKYKLSDAT